VRRGGRSGASSQRSSNDQFHRSLFGAAGLWWRDDAAALHGFRGERAAAALGKVLSVFEGCVQSGVFQM
jgi:hypothetical protein